MKLNILQHCPNEGPGFIRDWAIKNGHQMYVYHPYHLDNILPDPNDIDFLVILGGPMSTNLSCSWIKKEQQLINSLIKKNIPILGICFGAQQIAKALGAEVHSAQYKEVGWGPVFLESQLISGIPDFLNVLHWHEDMFEIPNNAEILFTGTLLKNQGFIYQNIIGLQFHLEPSKDGLFEMVVNDPSYPNENNKLMQDSVKILNNDCYSNNKVTLFKILDYLASYGLDIS